MKPLSNDDARSWLEKFLGSSLIRTISRTKSAATCEVVGEGGVSKVVAISLPRK